MRARLPPLWLPHLLERYDPDVIRFYVASVLPETDDTDFSWSEFVRRTNDELIAAWGNLVHRVVTFTARHWEGHIPAPDALRPIDHVLLAQVDHGFATIGALLEAVKLRAALRGVLELVRAVNGYLAHAPWFGVINEDKTAAATTVYSALRAIDSLKVLLAPFVPFSAERVHRALGYEHPLFGAQHIATYTERERAHEALDVRFLNTLPVSIASRHSRARGNPGDVLSGLDACLRRHDVLLAPNLRNRHLVYDATQATGHWAPSALTPGQRLGPPKPLYKKLEETAVGVELHA